MVLQETWLRSGTIRENIAYGRPDATEEEIIAAAREAHAHSFIMRLPDGYDTVISEDGGNISQGQKQLLCIARVMLTPTRRCSSSTRPRPPSTRAPSSAYSAPSRS